MKKSALATNDDSESLSLRANPSNEQQAIAERMDAVTQLAASVAQTFNGLLTVINAYTDLVIEQLGESDPRRADLVRVRRAGYEAASLTSRLMAFGGNRILVRNPLDINQVVEHMQERARRLVGDRIQLATLLTPGLGRCLGDADQIERVITNLVANSRDAMPTGGTVTIETANIELQPEEAENGGVAPGAYVMLAVRDEGVGMDATTRKRAFEPFFTTRGRSARTGFGLSAVYSIVKQSGGEVVIESEVGKGTVVRVYLPRLSE